MAGQVLIGLARIGAAVTRKVMGDGSLGSCFDKVLR